MLRTDEIRIRDPFIVPHAPTGAYWMFGTTSAVWGGKAVGFDAYRSADLQNWDEPVPAFRPAPEFWADTQFWAPEVHAWRGAWYMFASFKAEGRYRGTQILKAAEPQGPYEPISDGPATPPDWECLDGTFYVDPDGAAWMVFCHEWFQIHNGSVCAVPLTADLTAAAGRPVYLFSASEAAWAEAFQPEGRPFPCYITDGPFLHRAANGHLLMLWSSRGAAGYTTGVARSESGAISGPWTQDASPLFADDGGHAMIFTTFDGRIMLSLHCPNASPDERPVFLPIEERNGQLFLT